VNEDSRQFYVIPQKALQPPETLALNVSVNPGEADPAEVGCWITEGEGGDLLLNFPESLVGHLGWKPGDMLEFELPEGVSECIIRKVNLEHP
jgi:hypothetical protein